MPTYIVTAPDGKKYRVTAPEGTTREEVMARVQNTAPKASKEKPTSFWQGFGESVSDAVGNMAYFADMGRDPLGTIARKGAELLGMKPTPSTGQQALRTQRKLKDELVARSPYKGSTAGKITGGIVATLPLAPLGGPLTQGAVSGAMLTENPENPTTLLRDVAIGGAAGKVGDVVGRKIVAPAAKGLVNAAKKVAGSNMDEVAAAAAAEANPLAALGDDAIARAERFQRVGVQNPTTGMVTRDPRVWNLEQEGLKRMGAGDDILRQIQSVDDDLRAAGERLMGGFSGDTAEETGKAVQNVLTQKDKELGQAVRKLYTNIRAERGDVPVGGLQAFREMLDSPDVVDNAVFDGMRTSVLRRLERLGGNTTIGQAEELRKFVDGLGDGKDPAVRYMRGKLIESLDDDVVNSVGDDAFKIARDAAKARFDEFRKTFAGDIVEGKIAPERILPRALSAGKSMEDVRALTDTLLSGPAQREAMGQFRGQALRDVIAPAIPREGGPQAATLLRNFQNNAQKLREILPEDQFAQLEDYVQAVADARSAVPNSNVNYSNTAATIGNMFPDIAQGGGSRLRDVVRIGSRLLGGATGGAPGYAAAEVADRGAQMLAQRQVSQQVAQQARLASSPQAAAQALQEAQRQQAMQALLRQYGDVLGPLLGIPASASAVTISQ